jgi:hypothetical protein
MYKLGDLGQVAPLGAVDVQEGDARYISRELLQGDTRDLPAADVFALGLTLVELATGHGLPTGDEPYQQLRDGYLPLDDLSHLPSGLLELVHSMVHPDPPQRPTAADILEHPLVRALTFDAAGVAAVDGAPEVMLAPLVHAEEEVELGGADAATADVTTAVEGDDGSAAVEAGVSPAAVPALEPLT